MCALVVEDEATIAEVVAYSLGREGMGAEIAPTLHDARKRLPGKSLVVVDLGLPDGSGYDLVSELAHLVPRPGVIVLSSRAEEVDGVAALEAGADDFVKKPFSPRALVARARAVLRRRGEDSAPRERAASGLSVDLERREASYDGRAIPLTKTELDLLALLVAAPGRVHTRAAIVEQIWGSGHALTPHTVDSHVKVLRRKLADAGAPPALVASVHGVGFKLAAGG